MTDSDFVKQPDFNEVLWEVMDNPESLDLGYFNMLELAMKYNPCNCSDTPELESGHTGVDTGAV